MEEENYGLLFINKTPLLYNKKNVDRQKKIETWLNLYQLTRELRISKTKFKIKTKSNLTYII
jgi:hypothetical protein